MIGLHYFTPLQISACKRGAVGSSLSGNYVQLTSEIGTLLGILFTSELVEAELYRCPFLEGPVSEVLLNPKKHNYFVGLRECVYCLT